MSLIDNNGQVHLTNSKGQTIEVARISFAEYYNKEDGTTPGITALQITNPIQNVTDIFYFLSEEDTERVLFNSIKTNESTMPLIELYMQLMSRDKISFEEFLREVIQNYFISVLGYDIPEAVYSQYAQSPQP